jgi:hypothetical protein
LDVLVLAVNPWKLPVPFGAPDEMLLQAPVAVHVYDTAGELEVTGLPNVTPLIAPPLQTSCDAVDGRLFICGTGLTVIRNFLAVPTHVVPSIFGVTVTSAVFAAVPVFAVVVNVKVLPVPLADKPMPA